jgi:hypothetical protein
LIGDAYIVREPNPTKIVRRVGKRLPVDYGLSPEFYEERSSRAFINNLVFPLNQDKKGHFKLSCAVPGCGQRCEIKTKKQLIDYYYLSDTDAGRRKIEMIKETVDDDEQVTWCTHCGNIGSKPELNLNIVPKSKTYAAVCPKCLGETKGAVRTLRPQQMHEIPNDPTSPVHWYWSCVLGCGHRYLVESDHLKVEIGGQEVKSFVKSFDTVKKKSSISEEDRRDMSHLGTITSVVDERDIPPP